jgi:hypothetical protein
MRELVFVLLIGIAFCSNPIFAQRPYTDYSIAELEVKKTQAAVAKNYKRAAKFKEAIAFKNKIEEAIDAKERKKVEALEDQLQVVSSSIELEDFKKLYVSTDSIGHQFYHVLTIYKKNKIDWVSKGGSYIKTTHQGLAFIGRWRFKNYPDTIIIAQEGKDKEIVVSVNNLSSLSFKKTDRTDAWDVAFLFLPLAFGSRSSFIYLNDIISEFGFVYFMRNKKFTADLTLVRESDIQVKERERKNVIKGVFKKE